MRSQGGGGIGHSLEPKAWSTLRLWQGKSLNLPLFTVHLDLLRYFISR